jgi:hypothetical protein
MATASSRLLAPRNNFSLAIDAMQVNLSSSGLMPLKSGSRLDFTYRLAAARAAAAAAPAAAAARDCNPPYSVTWHPTEASFEDRFKRQVARFVHHLFVTSCAGTLTTTSLSIKSIGSLYSILS